MLCFELKLYIIFNVTVIYNVILTRTNTHVHATHAYTHMHTDTFTHIHTCLYTYTCMYKHTNTHTHKHTHTHTYIHTQIWEKDTLKLLKILMGHKDSVRCLQFTGDLLLSGTWDNSVKLVQPKHLLCFVPVKPCLHA